MAAVGMAREQRLPFVCGASINNYNRASLEKLHQWGMQRFVMPIELSKMWLQKVTAPKPNFEIEVMGHGYLPLAHSARCFTARHQGWQRMTVRQYASSIQKAWSPRPRSNNHYCDSTAYRLSRQPAAISDGKYQK